jgi:trigger factor
MKDMEVNVKQLEKSQVELAISLPWATWSKEIDHAAEKLAKNTKTPGFRPGKTPRAVLEQRFGKETLLAEAAEHAVNHAYNQALAEKNIRALGAPQVTFGDVKEGEALTMTIITDVMPEVILADWRTVAKKINSQFAKKDSAITDEAVTAEIERLAKMRAPLVTVNRPAGDGDTVLIDFVVTKDGVVIENGTSQNHPLVLGSNSFIPGFEEQVKGLSAGQEKTFTLTFPKEYHAAHLAGKEADFAVTIRAVQEMQVPELDDEFAKSLGAFDSLEAVKKNIREGMEVESKETRKNEQRTALLDALVEKLDIVYPESLVREELSRIEREFGTQLSRMGATLESFLEQSKKSLEDLHKDWEPQAKKRVGAYLILERISVDEKVFTESEEVEAEMNKALQYFKGVKDAEKNMDMGALYNVVSEQVRNEKIFQLLEGVKE